MANMTHPFDRDTLYELMEDGTVRISKDGKSGIFNADGVHLSGEIRESDPQLCNWITNNPDPDTQLSTSRVAGRDDKPKIESHLT